MSANVATSPGRSIPNRWALLAAGVISMITIANLQYAWAVFVNPMAAAHKDWSLVAIQGVYASFILVETWLVPFEAYLVDRFGPRIIISIGAVLVGLSWVFSGMSTTIEMLYASYVVGGLGAGCVYGAAMGMANKWFPDRRGLAVGLTAAGYGAGATLTVAPIQAIIENSGYQQAFIVFGIIQGVVCLVAAQFTALPPKGWLPSGFDPEAYARKKAVRQTLRQINPAGMVKTSHFWLLYLMFVLSAPGGLFITSAIGPIAQFYGLDKTHLALGATVLILSVQVTRALNGLARAFWGWISDHIGRENTMAIAFTIEGVSMLLWLWTIRDPWMFVIMSGVVFVGWGCVFALFSASTGDLFGTKYATTNYGIVYTAKGVASIIGAPVAAVMFEVTHSWDLVFYVFAASALITAALALFVLKPLTAKYVRYVEPPKPGTVLGS